MGLTLSDAVFGIVTQGGATMGPSTIHQQLSAAGREDRR